MNDCPLVLTPGDPAGIGPDCCLLATQHPSARPQNWLIVADKRLLTKRAEQLRLPQALEALNIFHIPLQEPAIYVLETLRVASQLCLDYKARALVTGPVNKAMMAQSGLHFSGHTEFLQAHTQSPWVQMLFVHPLIRVALATTHLPLTQVSAHLSIEGIVQHVQGLTASLQRYVGLKKPCIGILGVNPHAGESGYLGREEIEILHPAIERSRQLGLHLEGPLPADTAFSPAVRSRFDALLAMYHDQGLAPLKALGFGEAVNVTLGLPYLRTSVDHGTAYPLAGTGQADPTSLLRAIELAEQWSTLKEAAFYQS